jgi:N-acetylneuraminic acid mutarotase
MNFFNYLNFKSLNLFFILVLGIYIVEIKSFTPVGRRAHSSILVGTKLYFFGGVNDANLFLDEVFYLDVSSTFNTMSPPWVDLTASAKIPFKSGYATVSLIDNNNDPIIYLIGGVIDSASDDDAFISSVHTYNINTLEWKEININGKAPGKRRDAHAVNENGKIYIFSGFSDSSTGSFVNLYFKEMVILDTAILTWSTLNSPNNRHAYSATLLKNGVIVYIGGLTPSAIDINQINLYDTKNGEWKTMVYNQVAF